MVQQCPICDNPVDDSVPICPFCGFQLVGSTLQFQPLVYSGDSAGRESAIASKPSRLSIPSIDIDTIRASMDVIRGPQTGVSFKLADRPLRIGRDPQNDIFLNDRTVSREHAVVEPCGNRYKVSDLHSFNGVWVNDQNVSVRLLEEGDIIQIGAFCLLFHQE